MIYLHLKRTTFELQITIYHISTNSSFSFSKIFNWFFKKKSNSKQNIYSNGMINVRFSTYRESLHFVRCDSSRWRWLIVSKYVSIYLTGTIKIHHQQYDISCIAIQRWCWCWWWWWSCANVITISSFSFPFIGWLNVFDSIVFFDMKKDGGKLWCESLEIYVGINFESLSRELWSLSEDKNNG